MKNKKSAPARCSKHLPSHSQFEAQMLERVRKGESPRIVSSRPNVVTIRVPFANRGNVMKQFGELETVDFIRVKISDKRKLDRRGLAVPVDGLATLMIVFNQ